jgi:hypothetical protein
MGPDAGMTMRRRSTLSRRAILPAGLGMLLLPRRGRAQALTGVRLYPQVPLSNRLTVRLWNSPTWASAGTGHQTASNVVQLPSPPEWARLLLPNDQTGTTWPMDGAAFAPTSQIGSDPSLAYNAAGSADTTLWQSITFNNAGADIDPLSQAGGSTLTLTVPANTNPNSSQPIFVFSDWMSLAQPGGGALARIDGGDGFLLQVREFSGNGDGGKIRYVVSGGAPDAALGIAYAGSYAFADVGNNGNYTITPYFTSLGTLYTGFGVPYGLQYISSVRGATVLAVGDSIMSSLHSTGGNSGPVIRACRAVTSTQLPVAFCNAAVSGRKSSDFVPDGIAHVKSLKPQVAVIQAWSQNDQDASNSQATADNCFFRAMALADYCLRNGCMPILTTAAPVYYGQSPGNSNETYRVSNNARVRDAARRGMYVLDLDAIWGAGADPVTYANAAWQSTSGGLNQHPTDLGCAVAAQALAPMIARILGIS